MSATADRPLRDAARVERLCAALADARLDVLVCTLPTNVLLATGYWPVVGTACAVVTRAGRVVVIAPTDECELAAHGWADEIVAFEPGSLDSLAPAVQRLQAPLRAVAEREAPHAARIGIERGERFEPASYAALHLYGRGIADAIGAAWPDADVVAADAVLRAQRTVKTPREVEAIARACRAAGVAFKRGALRLRAGIRESEAAENFRAPLSTAALRAGAQRADGFTWCMAGVHAARAYGAYARSRATPLGEHELVLVHCNSHVDGRWTDITRTYCLGEPDARQRALYEAVFAARDAALATMRPGVRARDVDRAARAVLEARGFGPAFKHPTGHGVGFAAIDHDARPRLHPVSDDVLEVGMVCNVEPGIYLEGYGGLRHCDVVAVQETGAVVLTAFHDRLEQLTIG